MRAFSPAVTGFLFVVVAACGSYETSVIEVEKPARVASVSVVVPSSLVAGQTQRGVATVKDANGATLTDRAITWYSSNVVVASVSDSGVVAALTPGTATLSAVSEGVTGQAPVTVTPRPGAPVAKVLVALNPTALMIGQTGHAIATLQDSTGTLLTGRTVSWASSDVRIATVSAAGDVQAVSAGAAAITASSEGRTASANLTVNAPAPAPVARVTVSPSSPSVQAGATVQLSATTYDANNQVLTGRAITWASTDTTVATVSGSGLVTGWAAGTAQIKATSESQVGSATVTVSAPPPPPPPPGGTPVWRGNEPAGMTFIDERAFNSLNESSSWKSMASPAATIATDSTAPHSPSSVLQINYPAGFAGGSSPEFTERGVPFYRAVCRAQWPATLVSCHDGAMRTSYAVTNCLSARKRA